MDAALKHALEEFFERKNIEYQFLTGSKKIFDDPLVFGTLIILQLINEEWRFKPKTFEIRSLLTGMLGISAILCEEILEKYTETGRLELKGNAVLNKYTERLINLIKNLREEKISLSGQVEKIFSELVLPNINENNNIEAFNRMVESLLGFEKLL